MVRAILKDRSKEDDRRQDMTYAHGTWWVQQGKLTGKTDTDYFYFLCPLCHKILITTQYHVEHNRIDADVFFVIRFELYCDTCKRWDYVKVSNVAFVRNGSINTPNTPGGD